VILNNYVPSERYTIREDVVVTNIAVVRDVDAYH
jgi:hypothetical protein